MAASLTWLGHATLSLQIDDYRVVIDPFLAPANPAASREIDGLTADYILVTHGHGDHVASLVQLAKATGALVIANAEICRWVSKQGHERTHGMNTGGSYTFPFGRVKLTPALHSSGLPDGSYGGDPGGFLITAGDHKLYVAGDTALFSDMSLIGEAGLDAAVLPIGDNFTMGPKDALRALDFLKPMVAIPYHFGTWPVIAVDAAAWAKSVAANTTVKPVVLAVDELYRLW